MTHRVSTSVRIAVFMCAVAPFVALGVSAQEVLTMPEGLPEWTFNIPPKEQPWAVKVEGKVRAKGSARMVSSLPAQPSGSARRDPRPADPRLTVELYLRFVHGRATVRQVAGCSCCSAA